MSSKNTPAARLKKLSKEIPEEHITRASMVALADLGSPVADRAIALIGGAHLEKALEVAILSRLLPLKPEDRLRLFDHDHNGPLTTFDARIKIGTALGIFGRKTASDLDHIRHVRNAFAHSPREISFETAEVIEICNNLHTPTTISMLGRNLLGKPSDQTPRGFYVETVLTVASRLKYLTRGLPGVLVLP